LLSNYHILGGPKKWGHGLGTIIPSYLNLFKKISKPVKKFHLINGKFVVKRILKIPPHLAYIAALPCETLMSAKQTINDKLQNSVATYLRCGEVVNNQIK